MAEEEPVKKKRGPKPIFEKTKDYHRGAPRLATRVDPDVLDWVESRPEGIRLYIERIVRKDREYESLHTSTLTGQQEQDSKS